MSLASFSDSLPSFVSVVALGPEVEPEALMSEEAALLHPRTIERRRRSVQLGRMAARRALEVLGIGPTPILRGSNREPLWPDGIVGSITHAAGCAVAAVARETDCSGIGIDLEHRDRYFPELERYIAFEEEREWLGDLSGDHHARAVLEVFSAKESIYKALFPRVQRYFGFDAARLASPRGTEPREAWLVHDVDVAYPPGRRFPILTEWRGDLVLTAVLLEPTGFDVECE